MTTPAQARARADNGRRHSTGPKTAAGKEASSRNAVTHGGWAISTPVIPQGALAEDPEEYEDFRFGVRQSLDAGGPVENELADRIASVLWRSRRLPAFEAEYLAQAPPSAFATELHLSRQIIAWNASALRVLRDPAGIHTAADYVDAAVAAGYAAGVEMDDDWPQPRPNTVAGWDEFIDSTLTDGGSSRDLAARLSERRIEDAEHRLDRAALLLRTDEVRRIIEGDLLLKTSRVEAHLGRELSRHITLLRTLQTDRRSASDQD